MLLLSALMAGSGSAWAENVDVTFDFQQNTEKYGWSGTPAENTDLSVNDVFTNGNVTFTYTAKGSGSTDLRWWSTGDGLRSYKGNKFKVATSYGTIEKITITGTCTLTETTSTGGSIANSRNWTKPQAGGVTEVEFECNQSSGAKTIKNVKVTIAPPASSDPSSAATFSNTNPALDMKDGKTYSQVATTASGYTGTVTYSITANTAGATISGSTVTVANEGSVTVKATALAIAGSFAESTATYTLTVSDTRPDAELEWSESEVLIAKNATEYTLPTLNKSLDVTITSSNTAIATVDENGEVSVMTGKVGETQITAELNDESYKSCSVSYTITVYDPNKKGTIYNPYTVTDVINGTAAGTGVYVKGFIIGGYNSSNKFTTTASEFTNTNFCIADAANETTDIAPVQVPSGSIRTDFGIKDKAYNVNVAQVLIKGNPDTYYSRKGIKNVTEVTKVAELVSISSAGMATYYTDCVLDFSGFDDMYAYTASVSGDAITFARVTMVPAETGILLRNPIGEATSSRLVPVAESAGTVTSDFIGTLTDIASLSTNPNEGEINYILNDGSQGVGFYKANGQKLSAHKAYLQTSGSGVRSFIGFSDESTGIADLEVSKNVEDGKYYNLSGQRVAQPAKGLYIVNGKKIIIK